MGTIEAFLADKRGRPASCRSRMRFALIAHDAKKADLCRFAQQHRPALATHELIATGTTGARLAEATGLKVIRWTEPSTTVPSAASRAAVMVQEESACF